SDKTGTLTQNKMTVTEFPGSDETLLAEAMALCNDAEAQEGEEAVGEPTEAALVNYPSSLGISQKELQSRMPRVGEAPFDSVRKMMSTVHRNEIGR
ncbi:ATPase, partial [[Clostridium] symbiosum]|nr:ATPase [[Clostridium] symbiosum]